MNIDQSTPTTPVTAPVTTNVTGPVADEPATAPAPARPLPTAQPAARPAKPSSATFESLAVAGLVFGIFAMGIAVFALGLAARAVSDASKAGNGGGGTAPATLEVDLADFSITPKKAEISTGGDITIVNKGAVEHDLVVENKKSELVEAGAKGDLKLEDLAPGTYEMYCDVPGHRDAGMEGTLVVK